MRHKPYTARSLSGAQTRVRQLERRLREMDRVIGRILYERRMLAKLSADGLVFYNPLEEIEAVKIRDQILRNECRLNPDGTKIVERTEVDS